MNLCSLISTCNANVVLSTENWLDHDIDDSEMLPEHFGIYRWGRGGRRGGSTLFGGRKHKRGRPALISSNLEAVWAHLQWSFKYALLGF